MTVDLAEGDADAEPIRLAVIDDALAGQYNAVSWRMLQASDGPAAGATVLMAGSAQKTATQVDFSIAVTDESFIRAANTSAMSAKAFWQPAIRPMSS